MGLGSQATLEQVAAAYNVHPLAMEDVVNTRQRPKVEEYGQDLFVVLRLPSIREGELDIEQMGIYAGPGFVLTFQERPGDCLGPVRDRVARGKGRIRTRGADYLLYALIDAVVDSFFPILEHYGNQLDELEDDILREAAREPTARLLDIKRQLLRLRRCVWPLRDALRSLLSTRPQFFEDDTLLYLRDCADHLNIAADILETQREMSVNLMNVEMSVASQRLNETMRVLTVISTIFIPLSFVAGLCGMNFDPERSPWNMPETRWAYGYPFALLLMGGDRAGLVLFFKRRGWLRS